MSAIETCRTAALGGHVERCEDCAHERIAYNSCLMGTFSNGELAYWRRRFSVNCSDLSLHNSAVLRLRRVGHQWPITNGDEYVGDLLLGIEDAGASAERSERTIP
jgi:Transposase zinc-binding domain